MIVTELISSVKQRYTRERFAADCSPFTLPIDLMLGKHDITKVQLHSSCRCGIHKILIGGPLDRGVS